MPKLFFPIARAARKRYTFGGEIFSSIGNVVFLDLHAARLFTQGINAARKAAADPRESLRAGDMNAMGFIDEILHYVVGLYSERANPHAMPKALSFVQRSLGKPAVDAVLARYIQEFPPPGAVDPAVFLAGDEEGIPRREIVLQEILLLSLSNANPAFSQGWREALKEDSHLRAGLNVHDGKVTCEPVAAAHGLPYTPAESVLKG